MIRGGLVHPTLKWFIYNVWFIMSFNIQYEPYSMFQSL